MKIKLDNEWFIEDDGVSYELKKLSGKTDKKGNPTYAVEKHCGLLKSAIRIYIRMSQAESVDEVSLKEYLILIKKQEERINDLMVKGTNEWILTNL